MSEEQMVDLVQGALAARGITDEVHAAGQFTREATPAACSPAAWRAARPEACSARQERQ
jgi:hypothetical protein